MLYSAEKGNNSSFRGKVWRLPNSYWRACNYSGQQCTYKLYNEALRFSVKGKPINEGVVSEAKFAPGDRVEISHGSGVDSGKRGTVIPTNKVKTDGRGIPTNIRGAYQAPNWSKEVPIQLDSDDIIVMFNNRVTKVNEGVMEGGAGSGPAGKGLEKKSLSQLRQMQKDTTTKIQQAFDAGTTKVLGQLQNLERDLATAVDKKSFDESVLSERLNPKVAQWFRDVENGTRQPSRKEKQVIVKQLQDNVPHEQLVKVWKEIRAKSKQSRVLEPIITAALEGQRAGLGKAHSGPTRFGEGGPGSGKQKSSEEKAYKDWRTAADSPDTNDIKLRKLKGKYSLEKTRKYESLGEGDDTDDPQQSNRGALPKWARDPNYAKKKYLKKFKTEGPQQPGNKVSGKKPKSMSDRSRNR